MSILDDKGIPYRLEVIKTSSLKIDHSYQRGERSKIKSMVKAWDPLKCAALIVGKRARGVYYVVDGLQRTTAAHRIGVKSLPCLVFDSTGPKLEAELFAAINRDRTKTSGLENFRALLKAKDETIVAIYNIVNDCGFQIDLGDGIRVQRGSGWKQFRGVCQLEYAYKDGGEDGLRKTLKFITRAFNGKAGACKEIIIRASYEFLSVYVDELDVAVLHKRFHALDVEPLERRGSVLCESMGSHTSRFKGIVNAFVELYNKHTREAKRLPGFVLKLEREREKQREAQKLKAALKIAATKKPRKPKD